MYGKINGFPSTFFCCLVSSCISFFYPMTSLVLEHWSPEKIVVSFSRLLFCHNLILEILLIYPSTPTPCAPCMRKKNFNHMIFASSALINSRISLFNYLLFFGISFYLLQYKLPFIITLIIDFVHFTVF